MQAILASSFVGIALAADSRGEGIVAQSYVPKAGFVPDSVTAARIAEAVLDAAYGSTKIEAQKPLMATLHQGVWTIKGSLAKHVPGGVAEVRLAKQDGRILGMTHGR
jgi:hypothetical protein